MASNVPYSFKYQKITEFLGLEGTPGYHIYIYYIHTYLTKSINIAKILSN